MYLPWILTHDPLPSWNRAVWVSSKTLSSPCTWSGFLTTLSFTNTLPLYEVISTTLDARIFCWVSTAVTKSVKFATSAEICQDHKDIYRPPSVGKLQHWYLFYEHRLFILSSHEWLLLQAFIWHKEKITIHIIMIGHALSDMFSNKIATHKSLLTKNVVNVKTNYIITLIL